MLLADYFVMAVLGFLGLSLLVVAFEAFKKSSPMWKLIWVGVLLAVVTGVVLLMSSPDPISKLLSQV